MEVIRFCAPNTLIDVGANKGQFSLAYRALRPEGSVVAFEPLPEAAEKYEKLFRDHPSVRLIRVALAADSGSATFYIADRSDSSSLLKLGLGQERAFGVKPARTINVPLERLDNCIDFENIAGPIMMKVDVQGAELGVFDGCASLAMVDFIYVELSYVPLYEGQPLFGEVCEYLAGRGFAVRGLYNQVATSEYGPTQVDVLFQRATPPQVGE